MEENSNDKKKSRKMPAITSDGKLRIKELLTERGLKLQELANKIGCNREVISRAITGNPTYSVLANIAAALDVEVPDLFVSKKMSSEHDIRGVISFDGKLFVIDSYEDLLHAGQEIRKSFI